MNDMARTSIVIPRAEYERHQKRARKWAKEHGLSQGKCFSPYCRAAMEFFHRHRPKGI